MLKKIAITYGIFFVVIGILGFIHALTMGGNLFQIFEVNNLLNAIHLITGIIAFAVVRDANATRTYFQIFGVIYLLIAVLGFVFAGNLLMMHVNVWDSGLHLIIAVVTLYFGFIFKSKI